MENAQLRIHLLIRDKRLVTLMPNISNLKFEDHCTMWNKKNPATEQRTASESILSSGQLKDCLEN